MCLLANTREGNRKFILIVSCKFLNIFHSFLIYDYIHSTSSHLGSQPTATSPWSACPWTPRASTSPRRSTRWAWRWSRNNSSQNVSRYCFRSVLRHGRHLLRRCTCASQEHHRRGGWVWIRKLVSIQKWSVPRPVRLTHLWKGCLKSKLAPFPIRYGLHLPDDAVPGGKVIIIT